MKRQFVGVLFGICTIIWFSLCSNLSAAEFSGDFIIESGPDRQVVKVFVKDMNRRHEVFNKGTLESVLIFRPESKKIVTLMVNEKMYMAIPMAPDQEKLIHDSEAEAQLTEPVATETIDGYVCDKYMKQSAMGSQTIWIARKLQFPIRMEMTDMEGGKTVMHYENLKEGGVDESLFDVPSDYQEFIIPGMPGGMQIPDMPEGLKIPGMPSIPR